MRRSRLVLLACIAAAAVLPVTLAFAQASSAPTVTTAAATSVSSSSVTLNGSVNPNSASTQYAFQYGPTSSYGEETAVTSAGSGAGATNVSASVTGLQPGSTYHFRIIAINGDGTSVGSDQTFTTTGTALAPSTPPTATTAVPTAIGQAGATLNGTFNPQGQATTFYFEYGPTGNYGFETNPQTAAGTSPIIATATISGLSSGATYHFRLVAISPGGVTLGSDATFTTTTPPTVTSGPATDVTNDGAVFNGTVNPEGQSTTYYFQYGTTTGYGLQTAPASAGSGTGQVGVGAPVTGLASNTTYHFRLVATSSGGINYGDDETVATAGSATPASVVRLMGRMGFVSPGNVIGVEVGCFGSSPCDGTFKVTVGSTTIGTGSFKLNGNTGWFQNIKLNSTGVNDLRGNSVNHLLDTDVYLTTTSGQTINGRLSMARWNWKDN